MRENAILIPKILVVMGLSALVLISAVVEGYTNYLHGYVIVFLGFVLAGSIINARVISVAHLLGLILFGFIIGFITQTIGVTSDMWCYDHTFIFATLSWSLAAVTMEGISRILKWKLGRVMDNPLNVLAVLTIFALLPITLALQDYWKYAKYRPIPREFAGELESRGSEVRADQAQCFIFETMPEEGSGEFQSRYEPNVPFWIYYVSLVSFAVVLHYHTSFTELLSLILAAWIMGGIGEWIGATAKLWHFRTETLPPLFLVLVCWPLEFLVIRALAIRNGHPGKD